MSWREERSVLQAGKEQKLMWLIKGVAFLGLMALGLVLLLAGIVALLGAVISLIEGAYFTGVGLVIVGLITSRSGWRLLASRVRRSRGRPTAQKPHGSSKMRVHTGAGKPSKPSKIVNVVWWCLLIGSLIGSIWIAVGLFSGLFALLAAGAMMLVSLVLLEVVAKRLVSLGLLAPPDPAPQPTRTAGTYSAAGISLPANQVEQGGNGGGHGGHYDGGHGGGFFGGGHGGGDGGGGGGG